MHLWVAGLGINEEAARRLGGAKQLLEKRGLERMRVTESAMDALQLILN